MVVTPSFTHQSITFSNQRFSNLSPTVDVGFVKLTLVSFYGNRLLEISIQFCCLVTCVAVVEWFRETNLSVRWLLSVSADFRPLLLFADVIFPWFIYANITYETVALDTPNNVAVFVTDAPEKRTPTIYSLSKSDTSPIFRFFYTDRHTAVTNALTRALQNVNKRNNIQCCQLKFFKCSQYKFYSSVG
jgi:hypothetical protein